LDAAVSLPSLRAPSIERRGPARLWLLLALLLSESALALSLHTLGWFETGGLLRQAACALLALLPLVVAVALVAWRRFRFSIQVMLIATALLALFMWISVLPLYEALAARRGTQALSAEMTPLRDFCSLEKYFKSLPSDPRPPAPPKPAVRTLSAWLRPLAGEALRLPVDAAVREIRLEDDRQAAAFVAHVERFRSLTYVSVSTRGISASGMATILETLPKVTGLVQLHVTCPVPKGIFRSAAGVRCVWIDSGTRVVNLLGPDEVRDLASLKNLQHLDLRHVRISDADLQLLAQSDSLRLIILRAEGVTPEGIERLKSSMPECDVRLIPPP
jgi:energy-coupling factor transporter transmembrane protein EcfT